MTGPTDIYAYLAAGLEDIPGKRVFTAVRARQGYHLNQFAISLMKAENRQRWKVAERAYLDGWRLTEEQKQAVLNRDFNPYSTSAVTSISSPKCSRPSARASSKRYRR